MLAESVRAMKDIVLDLNQRNLYCYTGVVVTFTSPTAEMNDERLAVMPARIQ